MERVVLLREWTAGELDVGVVELAQRFARMNRPDDAKIAAPRSASAADCDGCTQRKPGGTIAWERLSVSSYRRDGCRRTTSCAVEAESRVWTFVERIDEVDVTRRDELVLDEYRERHRLLLQHAERKRNDGIAISLREVGYSADEARARAAEFVAGLADGVLADDGAALAGADLLECVQGGHGADVVDRSDQRAARGGAAQILADDFEHLLEVAAAIEVRDRYVDDGRQLGAQSVNQAGDAEFQQRAGDGQFEQHKLIDLATPVLPRPAAQRLAADQAGPVVVRPEVGTAPGWGISMAMTGVLASRNLEAMAGATRS